jgi:aryl-alcohol dehydrogenase-like predicted oxidoreductase
MNRRRFIKTAVVAGLTVGVDPGSASAPVPLPRRRLGRTGEVLSIIGFGGIVVIGKEQQHADRSVARAVEEYGINYFDVAPSYGRGEAEEKLGPALEPYRKSCFLACKTTQRSAAGAREELHASFRRLRTDYFDLYQLHAIKTLEDVETAFGPDGAMETFLKAREEGKVRYIGFAAHSVEAAMAALERFDFDTALFPINYALWTQENFGPQVIGLARERNMGILVLKALGRGSWAEGAQKHHSPCWYEPVTDPDEARLALSFALAQGATSVVPPGNEDLFWMAVAVAGRLPEMDRAVEQRLRQLTADAIPLFRYSSQG